MSGAVDPTVADDVWGEPPREFPMVVERGAVTAFRRAVGADERPAVPPTFAVVADQWDPDFARRPPAGAGWADGPPATLLHVEQWFEYGVPLKVGEKLTVRRGAGRSWEREGRSGRLQFLEERTELVGGDGAVRVATGWVDVRTETDHREVTTAQRTDEDRPIVAPRSSETVLVEDLSVTQIVGYVGVTGDLHPLHHDRTMAVALGYPDVFAPGMLTMALTARVLTDHLGTRPLASLRSRFRAQVWPGDTLAAELAVIADGAVTVRTRNQFDDVVLETTALVAAERPRRGRPVGS